MSMLTMNGSTHIDQPKDQNHLFNIGHKSNTKFYLTTKPICIYYKMNNNNNNQNEEKKETAHKLILCKYAGKFSVWHFDTRA